MRTGWGDQLPDNIADCGCVTGLVVHPKRGAFLRSGAATIVEARCRNICVAQPLLHLGNVGLMCERVGRRRRAQRVHADPVHLLCQPDLIAIVAHDLSLHRSGLEWLPELAAAAVAFRAEQWAFQVRCVSGLLQISFPSRCASGCAGTNRILPRFPCTRECRTPSRLCADRRRKARRVRCGADRGTAASPGPRDRARP